MQTRTQSLFMCFWGERRLGVRLRRCYVMSLSMTPRARLNLTPNLLSPQKHINSDCVRVCIYGKNLFCHIVSLFNQFALRRRNTVYKKALMID